MSSELTYVFSGRFTLSTDPELSDSTTNQTVLDSLIGTLVKYGPSGRLEPYLAKWWETSTDSKSWTFHLRAGLKSEDGITIDAVSYTANLKSRLLAYAETTNVMEFEKLKGWEAFKESRDKKDLVGIRALDELTLLLEFDREPENLLNLLRMPYFGFYSPQNFIGSKWKDSRKIVSSGAYRLVEFKDDYHVSIKKRPDWFSQTENSIETVNFVSDSAEQVLATTRSKTIILAGAKPFDSTGFFKVSGTPTILTALALSPFTNSIFTNEHNRRVFERKLREIQNHTSFPAEGAQPSKYFYPTTISKLDTKNTPIEYQPSNSKNQVEIGLARSLPEAERNYIFYLVAKALEGSNTSLIKKPPGEGSEIAKLETSNTFYDIRITRVDIGPLIRSSTIKMMFCSKMGVTFPDVKNSICDLVRRYESKARDLSTAAFASEFNQRIYEDALVIPLFHSSKTWFYSEDIDPATISPIPNYPRIEYLRFR